MPFTLKAELHCHSNTKEPGFKFLPYLPDSVQTVEEIILTCRKKGIKVLAITDHDSLQGYYYAKHYLESNNLDILLIPACEISAKGGHVLAYGITEEIPRKLSVKETIDRIHQQGGLAVAAHPYTFPYALGNKAFHLDFDAIESFNGPTPMLLNLLVHRRATKQGILTIAGSDSHETCSLGHGLTFFPSSVRTASDCLRSLKKGNFSIGFKHTNRTASFLAHLKVLLINIFTNTRTDSQPLPLPALEIPKYHQESGSGE